MLDFNLCPHAIKKCCESIINVPEIWGEMYEFVMEIIECWDMWSFDKNTTQIESMLLAILTNYTSDRFHYNWFSSQYVITMEILEREGYDNEVMDYYEHYDDSDEDFNRFWEALQISHPNLDIEKINRESMAYHSKYSILHYKLKEFAEIRNIDFAKLAERAGWHKDFWGLSTNTPITTQSSTPPQTPPPTKWQDYIIGADKEAWERLITEELNNAGKHSGRLFAMIILAMQREGAIKEIPSKTKFYALMRVVFPLLSSDQSINKHLNTNSPNSCTTPISDDEIEAIIKKVSCY